MPTDLGTLSAAAVAIGFVHCVCGPDHYIPFVAMSRVGLWSFRKTMLVTFLCGVGHVAGSAVVGLIGIALGVIVFQLEAAESVRSDLAAWLLGVFGFLYFLWGAWYASRRLAFRGPQPESETCGDAEKCAADLASRTGTLTPWILFAIFVFGPCEPLIPLLMYPAAKANVVNVVCVTVLFGLTTLVTMTALVALIYFGTCAIPFPRMQIFGHALAGFALMACAAAIVMGL